MAEKFGVGALSFSIQGLGGFGGAGLDGPPEVLQGNISLPPAIPGEFLMVHPPVEYVVVHEGFERGYFSDFDYDLKSVIEKRPDFKLVKIVPSQIPEAQTWIFQKFSTSFSQQERLQTN